MDRSAKDKENNLNKWIDIVFKPKFMLKGVKSYMIKLAFQLVNRYADNIEAEPEFSTPVINQVLTQMQLVSSTMRAKLLEAYSEERADPQTNIE